MKAKYRVLAIVSVVMGIVVAGLTALPVAAINKDDLLREYREATDIGPEAWLVGVRAESSPVLVIDDRQALLREYREATDPSLEAWAAGMGATFSTFSEVRDRDALLREYREATDPSLEAWAVGVGAD